MMLMTKEIAARLPKLYATEKTPNREKIAQVKYFVGSRGTWYGVEFDGQDLMYGYVVSMQGPDYDEWGYWSLAEMKETSVERDMYFTPAPMSELVKEMP